MIKKHTATLLLVLSVFILTGKAQEKPNIVLFISDDMGWNDVGYHGSQAETPNIDRLVTEGMELDRFYVHPICSPTRTAMMTGRLPSRFGITSPLSNDRGVPVDEHFLPESFQAAGYQTWLTGKWHLGASGDEYGPLSRGFDHFYGHLGGMIDYFKHTNRGTPDWQRNGEPLDESGYSTDLIATEVVRLIKQRDPDKPVFLMVPFNAPHGPSQAPSELTEKYENKGIAGGIAVRLASIDSMDQAMGRILDALDQQNMKNNTLVMFFCDNGPKGNPKKNSSSQAGLALRGGKGQIYEGGTRVPAAIRWPAKIEPGSKCEDCLSVLDLLPTLTAASGISHGAEKPLDGSNRWPLFQGQKTEPAPIIIAGGRGVMAAIEDPLKLIKTANGDELYNIRKDPEETTDIASDQPESVERLNTILKPFSEAGPRSKRGKKGKQKGKSKGKKERSKGKPTAETRQDYQLPPSPQPVGEAGIAWYTTWDTAMAEATRSKRPIFFMSAAGTCSGVSGIF